MIVHTGAREAILSSVSTCLLAYIMHHRLLRQHVLQ
jgi:hypothetical protein